MFYNSGSQPGLQGFETLVSVPRPVPSPPLPRPTSTVLLTRLGRRRWGEFVKLPGCVRVDPEQQHRPPLGQDQNCRSSGPSPDPLNENLHFGKVQGARSLPSGPCSCLPSSPHCSQGPSVPQAPWASSALCWSTKLAPTSGPLCLLFENVHTLAFVRLLPLASHAPPPDSPWGAGIAPGMSPLWRQGSYLPRVPLDVYS